MFTKRKNNLIKSDQENRPRGRGDQQNRPRGRKFITAMIIASLVLTILPLKNIAWAFQEYDILQAIEGEIFILGEANFGEVLTVDISGILPEEATYTIQWNRNGIPIEEITDIIYTITVEDIAQEISVTLTGTGDFSGSITSPVIIPGKAYQLSTPQIPLILDVSAEKITVLEIEGHEYRINYGNWQTSGVFTGLNSETTYRIYSRIAETETHLASGPGFPVNATTKSYFIETNKYYISGNKFISEIAAGTTVKNFKTGFLNDAVIKVFTDNSEVLESKELVTGMTVKKYIEEKVTDELTISVKGDITGNGKIGLADFVQLKSHLLGKSTLAGEYATAADISSDGKVSLADYIAIKSYLIGKEQVKANGLQRVLNDAIRNSGIPDYAFIRASVYSPETKQRAFARSAERQSPASTIKTLFMMFFLEDAIAGKRNLNGIRILVEEDKWTPTGRVAGNGIMQHALNGTIYTWWEVIDLMITKSDNVAVNMVIKELGIENIRQRIKALGLKNTNFMGLFFDGKNTTTTANDMTSVLEELYKRSKQHQTYRDGLNLMQKTTDKARIARYLPDQMVYNKIGQNYDLVADMGYINYDNNNDPVILSFYVNGKDRTPVSPEVGGEVIGRISRDLVHYLSGKR